MLRTSVDIDLTMLIDSEKEMSETLANAMTVMMVDNVYDIPEAIAAPDML
jgi:hypothetical protein